VVAIGSQAIATPIAAKDPSLYCSFNGTNENCVWAGGSRSFTLTTDSGRQIHVDLVDAAECSYPRCGTAYTTELDKEGRFPPNPVIKRWFYESQLNDRGLPIFITFTSSDGGFVRFETIHAR